MFRGLSRRNFKAFHGFSFQVSADFRRNLEMFSGGCTLLSRRFEGGCWRFNALKMFQRVFSVPSNHFNAQQRISGAFRVFSGGLEVVYGDFRKLSTMLQKGCFSEASRHTTDISGGFQGSLRWISRGFSMLFRGFGAHMKFLEIS